MGARHKNNAIILTTIEGERGIQGFPGPDGQTVYTGTGDPNTLSLTLPSYSSDPASTQRGTETLYYQDTVTGEVWSLGYTNGLTIGTWVKTTVNIKGATGATGATAIDKIDVNLMKDGNMSIFEDTTGGAATLVCRLIFPGTDAAPDFTDVKVVSVTRRNTSATLTVTDQDDNVVATGPIGASNSAIDTLAGTFPTGLSILTVTIDVVRENPLDLVTPSPVANIGYITIR